MPKDPNARLVPGVGPRPCPVAFYGEAPGRQEQNFGRPFVGDAGAVLTLFLSWFGIARHTVFVSNLVKYWPGEGNPDPSPADIARDAALLEEELETVRPRLIVALGRFAASHFLGYPVDMDLMHGIPHWGKDKRIVIPVYHPAVGLHDLSMAQRTWFDLQAACAFIKNPDKSKVWAKSEKPITVKRVSLRAPEIITPPTAIDTEGVPGRPFSVQYSWWPDMALVVSAEDAKWLDFRGPVIFHNAKYDVRMLREMGVKLPPVNLWHDTMVRAYCRQDLPHGLKPLSYRLLRRPMQSFDDTVRRHFNPKAIEYLRTVAACKGWGRPDETLIEDSTTGSLRIYRPQAVNVRAGTIVRSFEKKPDETDIHALWYNITPEQRADVEAVMGPFPKYGIELVPRAEADTYGGTDAAATLAIHQILDAEPVPDVYAQDVACIPALVEIETTGLPFSVERAADLNRRFLDEALSARAEMREIADKPNLNPGSVKQISEVLFKDWGIRSPRKTKLTGNDSTDDRALSTLALQWATKRDPDAAKIHRFITLLQEYREVRKLSGTYVGPDAIPAKVRDGRIYGRINNTQVVSGRLSSSDPNLQNIPSRTERGKLIRSCFVAPDGHTLLSVDYSQIELRVLAHESGDPALIEAFTGAEDLHRKTEKYIFGVPDEKAGTKRVAAKTFNFRIAYAGPGGSPRGLQEQLFLDGIVLPVEACADYRDRWFEMYPRVAAFLRAAGDEARRYGYASTAGGRRRYLPFARLNDVPRARAEAERQAGNVNIQGRAQEVIKGSMVRWDKSYREKVNRIAPTKLCMQIHDELLFEVGTRDSKILCRVADRIIRMMLAGTEHFAVPILAEAKAGTDWGSQKKLEDK